MRRATAVTAVLVVLSKPKCFNHSYNIHNIEVLYHCHLFIGDQ